MKIMLSKALVFAVIVLFIGTAFLPNINSMLDTKEDMVLLNSENLSLNDWNIQFVDPTGKTGNGEYNSIALDTDDNPYIISTGISINSRNNFNDLVLLTNWTGKKWNFIVLASDERTTHAFKYTSIALDSKNNPYIIYYAYKNTELRCSYLSSGRWITTVIDSDGNVGEYCSIAIDSMDRPHISYVIGYEDYDLKYAFLNGTKWEKQIVDNRMIDYDTSIVTDSNDKPHICYTTLQDNADIMNLNYAYLNGNEWKIQFVDTFQDTGGCKSIAIDSNNQPHISYYDSYFNYDLKYAYLNGSKWDIQIVDTIGGEHNSISIDSKDIPHISYSEGVPFSLKYAYFDNNKWIIEVIDDSSENKIYSTSIKIDSKDIPHISYQTNGCLKYANKIDNFNNPPNKPDKPSGEINGKYGIYYSYTSSSTDPDGDQLYYIWYWDHYDYMSCEWIGPKVSGDIIQTEHRWIKDVEYTADYTVKVMAKDVNGGDSPWSDPLPITMPKNKAINPFLLFLERLMEQFPILEQILQSIYDKLA